MKDYEECGFLLHSFFHIKTVNIIKGGCIMLTKNLSRQALKSFGYIEIKKFSGDKIPKYKHATKPDDYPIFYGLPTHKEFMDAIAAMAEFKGKKEVANKVKLVKEMVEGILRL